MRLLTERANFLVECLDLPEAAQVDDAKWEPFQINHLNDDSIMRIEDKSRQIAWSWTVAAEAIANAVLNGESTVFVSINQDEASEKIRYARRVYENLGVVLPEIVTNNILGLEFDNKARILSLPSREPRGKAQMHIVLDEFAHVQHDKQIYGAATPIISKGGRLRIGSSPMGAGGMHWEISQQELQTFPDFNRASTPWWAVHSFCRTKPIDAYSLPTRERVERFGNERIQILFRNSILEDFQQEHECMFVDETISFFTWDLIRSNQDPNLICYHLKNPDDMDLDAMIRGMKSDRAAGKIEKSFVGGIDIGRKKDLTEIFFVGLGHGDLSPLRLMISLDKLPFKKQSAIIRRTLGALPIVGLLVDETGMGMQLAEDLEDDTIAEGATFTNATKQQWATEVRKRFEARDVPIPSDRDLAYQIHSVKKLISPSKNVVFDVDSDEKHHADKFWALALAVWVARENRTGGGWKSINLRNGVRY